ncbi:hypothetical protein [Aquimarina rhabdastrellae]
MKTNFLNLSGVKVLSKENQRTIKGSAIADYSLCGCSCSGAVTGPEYCKVIFACTQEYSCQEES